jgi:hypothetical protein
MANLDTDPAQEIFVRATTSVQVFQFVGGAWTVTGTGIWPDDYSTKWWNPQYYETITSGDLNGDGVDEIIGRGADGIEAYQDVPGQGYTPIVTGPSVMTDQENWNQPQYYETIRVADVDGDGADDVLGIDPAGGGLVVYSFAEGTFTQGPGTQPWTESAGWGDASWYSTIDTADLNGDGVSDIYGRTKYGIDAWTYAGSTWSELVSPAPSAATPSILTDSESVNGQSYSYEDAQYYETIQPAVLDAVPGANTPAHILARSPAGVAFYRLGPNGAFEGPTLPADQFSDANGWNQSAVRYSTIFTAQVEPGLDLLMGKDATGMRTYRLDGGAATGQWADPSARFPAWSNWSGPSPPTTPPTKPADYPAELWRKQVASYSYINQQYDSRYSVDGTVLDELGESETSLLTGNQVGAPSFIGGLPSPTGQNIDRDTWEATRAEVQGWTLEAAALQSFFFNTDNSLQQLILQTQVVSDSGANSPSEIASNHFSSNMGVDALIGDLIWGVLGALPGGDAAPILTAIFSMTGAGASAGMGFLNPNGKVSTEADKLNTQLVNAFCGANAFLSTSYSQILNDGPGHGDAGLLGAMGRMTIEGPLVFADAAPPGQPPNPTQFSEVAAASNDQRVIWIWQQFASQKDHSWRVGYCWGEGNCNLGFIDRVDDGYGVWYGIPPNFLEPMYGYYYRVISTDGTGVANCEGSSHGGDGGWYALTQAGVGFDTNNLFTPRTQSTRMPPDPQMENKAYQQPAPINASGYADSSGTMGILGWRVGDADCNT